MTSAAVDLIKLTQLEPPAPPPPATPEPDAPSSSFHDHLRQAERRTSDDATSSSSSRDDGPTRDTASSGSVEPTKERGHASDDHAQAERTSGTQDKKKADAGDDKKDDHQAADAAAKPATHVATQAAPVAAVAPVVQPAGKPDAKADGAVVAEDAHEAKATDKAVAANLKTALPVAVAGTPVVTAAVKPTTEKKGDAKSAREAKGSTDALKAKIDAENAAHAATAKHADSAKHNVAQTKTVTNPEATSVAATPAKSDEKHGDKGSSHGRADANKEAHEPGPAAATPVAPGDASVPDLTPTTAADAAAAATSAVDSKPSADSTSKSPAPGDATSTTRIDQPQVAQRQQLAAHRELGFGRTSTTESNSSLSQSDRLRLVQRVARAVQTAVDRGGDLKLRLSPPELGSLHLQVKLTDGALSARIETDNPAAKQVLMDNLPALRDRLADQNIRVEKFDVDLSNSGGGGASQTPQQPFSDAGNRTSRTGSGSSSGMSAAAVDGAAVERAATSTVNDGRLNVVV